MVKEIGADYLPYALHKFKYIIQNLQINTIWKQIYLTELKQ